MGELCVGELLCLVCVQCAVRLVASSFLRFNSVGIGLLQLICKKNILQTTCRSLQNKPSSLLTRVARSQLCLTAITTRTSVVVRVVLKK